MKSNPMQGTRGGKSVEPEAALGESTKKLHKKGIAKLGNKDGVSVVTKGSHSNHETLRHGSKPQPEAVKHEAPHNPSALSKARKYNERSQNGGANPMAAAGL